MSKVTLLFGLLLSVSLSVTAQDFSRPDLFVGYTYDRTYNSNGDTSSSNPTPAMECRDPVLVRSHPEIVFVACQRLIHPCESEDLLHARFEIDELQLAAGLLG